MPKVGIVSLGFVPANLDKLCKWLNRVQNHFIFEKVTEIVDLGEPDMEGYGYSDSRIEKLVNPHIGSYDFVAILTSVPIEGNYFSRTLYRRFIILTYHQSEELLVASKRTHEEYAALGIAMELTSFEFQRVTCKGWRDLFHQDPRGCLFDFAGVKSQKLFKLKNCHICDPCRGKLFSANIDQRVLSSVVHIVDSVVRPNFGKALSSCIKQPGLGFIYGGVIISTAVNLFSSFIFQDTITRTECIFFAIIALGVLLFPIGKYAVDWVRFIRNRRR